MIWLDASAMIGYLREEPSADEVEALIRGDQSGMLALNVAEVVDRLARLGAFPVAELKAVVDALFDEHLSIHSLERAVAWRAGELRATHYDRRRSALSMADACLLASAAEEDSIATTDGALLAAAEAEGIATIVLPDSSGRPPI